MKQLRNFLRPKVMLTGLTVAVMVALGYGMLTQKPAEAAQDCDNNAVIKCGFSDLNNFLAKYQANATGDLPAIYSHFGMGSASDFAKNAKHVTTYKDGRVVLDNGTVIATNAASLGRQTGNGNNYSISIGGKTYYWGYNGTAYGASSIPGYALINPDDHSMVMAVLTSCGNPEWGTSPGYKCQMLNQTKVNDTTYKYVATPYAKNATIEKIVYDFGDGSSQTVTSNFGQTVQHTYKPGDYTAKATVYFTANGQHYSDTRAECTKPVHVPAPKPTFTCTELVAKQVNGSRTKFTFTATGAGTNGAVLQSGNFIFDDGSQSGDVKASGNTVTVTHEYAKEGDHTTKADLTFNDGKDINNPKCVTTTTTTPETCKDTPNKPECTPCQYNSTVTSNSPACKPPEQNCTTNPEMSQCQSTPSSLPSTGPEQIVGTMLGLGSVTGAGVYYRSSRRNLIDLILRRR